MNRGGERHVPAPVVATEAARPSPALVDDQIRADLLDPCPSCGEAGPHEPGDAPGAVRCRRGECGAWWGEQDAVFVACAVNGDLGEDTKFAALSAIRDAEDRGVDHDAATVAAILRSVLTDT